MRLALADLRTRQSAVTASEANGCASIKVRSASAWSSGSSRAAVSRDPAVMRGHAQGAARALRARRSSPSSPTTIPRCRSQPIRRSPSPISSRCIVDALELKPADKVLEIGTGSGYAAAVLAELAREVFTIERQITLCRRWPASACTSSAIATSRYAAATEPWVGPRQRRSTPSSVAAGGPTVPQSLRAQLAIGRPAGDPASATRARSGCCASGDRRHGRSSEEDLGAVRFVPLIGAEGWPRAPALARVRTRPSPHRYGHRTTMRRTTARDSIARAAEPLPSALERYVELGSVARARSATARVDICSANRRMGRREFYDMRARLTLAR